MALCGLIYHLPPATGEQLTNITTITDYIVRKNISKRTELEKYRLKTWTQHDQKLGSKTLQVLEIGSANGILLYWLRELFEFEVYGIELDPISSEYAKKLIEPDHIFVGHTENAPFIDGSFDLVIMNQVIEHSVDPATWFFMQQRKHKPAMPMSQLQILVGFL